MYKSLGVPFVGWLSVSSTYEPPRWAVETGRGRTRGWECHVTLYRWTVSWHGRGQPYWKLVGFERKPSVDWMLDEFDASFNALAIASIRYHLDYSVLDRERFRESFEDLIARLSEPRPRFTEEEMAVLEPPGWKFEDEFIPQPDGSFRMKPRVGEERAIYDAQQAREDAWHERIQQARHDFIDILPHLWS
ncbi:hypothetical protein [Nocardia farcinica]|uniref:Uncharacterized protein n=1 Tax=Nocardia farcinica (strain IFM 10152) TaxID=247156 RepID=Q5YSP1_NOCFA|nr:hypothetical protein [Nocardia farcinica]BAD58800.1 hypothetical protein NFA_39520 [Nocardia farcinica IFM 10152]